MEEPAFPKIEVGKPQGDAAQSVSGGVRAIVVISVIASAAGAVTAFLFVIVGIVLAACAIAMSNGRAGKGPLVFSFAMLVLHVVLRLLLVP